MREIDDSSVSRFLSETMGGFDRSVNPLIDGVMQVGLWLATDETGLLRPWAGACESVERFQRQPQVSGWSGRLV